MFLIFEEYHDYDDHDRNDLFLVSTEEEALAAIEIMEAEKKASRKIKQTKYHWADENRYAPKAIKLYNDKVREIVKVYPLPDDDFVPVIGGWYQWNEYEFGYTKLEVRKIDA